MLTLFRKRTVTEPARVRQKTIAGATFKCILCLRKRPDGLCAFIARWSWLHYMKKQADYWRVRTESQSDLRHIVFSRIWTYLKGIQPDEEPKCPVVRTPRTIAFISRGLCISAIVFGPLPRTGRIAHGGAVRLLRDRQPDRAYGHLFCAYLRGDTRRNCAAANRARWAR